MQVELIGGPEDGKVLGVPDEERQYLRFPFMRQPVYMVWTDTEPTSAIGYDYYQYERIKGLSDRGYTRFKYVKGT